MRSTRLLGAAGLVGSCLAIFACSASPTTKERTSEKLGVTRQALGAEYVCAMTHGTDYGYPVFDPTRGKTWFLFGDNFDVVGSPDPLGSTTSSTPTCAITRQDNPPIVLTGFDLGGSRTPIGAAYIPLTAPDTYGDRIIAGFTATTPGEPDANIRGVLGDTPAANPSTFAPILDDTDQAPILADPSHFFIMAPLVVKASAIGDPMTLPGTSTRILLVFGTGKPFRASGIYLAAVRLDRLRDRSSWRFLDANRTWASSVTSAARLFADMPPPDGGPYATGCAGEISVGYNAPFRKYMLVYKCYARYLNGRGPAEDGVVVMRTTESPLDSWSPPRALFAPKKEGIPDDGDDAYGSFMHRANLRLYRASLFDPLQRLPTDVVGRNEPECIRHNPPDCNCVATFPAACAPPDHDPLGFDETKGCCVESNKCCDRLYDRYPPESGGSGSGTDGASYAPSVVHAWSEALDGDAYHPTTRQNLYYVMSTWNPYQVVLMKNEIVDNDTDNDGRDDLHDNCPAAYNPGQENCNRAAEEAWNARHPEAPVDKLGDACDPTPCPTAESIGSLTQFATPGCSSTSWTPRSCKGRHIKELLDVTPRGASPLTENMRAALERLPTNIVVPNVATHPWFCQDTGPQTEFNCSDPQKMSEGQFLNGSSPEDEQLDGNFIWHRVQLQRYCAPDDLLCVPSNVSRGDAFAMDYGPEKRKYIWEYAADSTFWTTGLPQGRIIPNNPDPACLNTADFGSGTCLAGRLWMHGDTPIGSDTQFNHDYAPAPGFPSPGVHVGVHGIELANRFFDAIPDGPFTGIVGGMQMRPLFFIRLTLPDPHPTWKFSDGRVLPIVSEDGQQSVVFDDGHREGIADVFTPAARDALVDPSFTWMSAEEASPYAGNPTRPLGIAVVRDSDVMVLRETLKDTGDGHVDVGGAPQLMSGGDGAPAARTDFVAVYSRARGRVFLMGGRDATTGEPLHDLWSFELDRGTWKRLWRIEGALNIVFAATYSYRDGGLWVLDRDSPDPSEGKTRLLRVELATSGVEVVREAYATGGVPRYGDQKTLGVDVDGNVVLSASNASPQRHRVAVITSRTAGYDVAITACRKRALATPPLADLHGFAFHYKQDAELDATCSEEPQPLLGGPAERVTELALRSATLSDLEDLLQ